MAEPRSKTAKDLFLAALDLTPSERVRLLDENSGGDAELRREVEVLLAHEEAARDGFLEPKDAPDPPGSPDGGRRIGPYEVVREIGRGGQGAVYLARDPRLPRQVALKVLWPSALLTGELLQRFRREADVASRLDHPGICTVLDTGTDGGLWWIAMRLVPGETLAQKIARARAAQVVEAGRSEQDPDADAGKRTADDPHPSPSPSREEVEAAMVLFEKAARALHAAHEAGVTHRDIKPGNIMITPEGEPVILDFGLARAEDESQPAITRTGDVFGTPSYMSPEQIEGSRGRPDRRADVYALGVTLYECLTLRRPFESATREGLYQRILAGDPTGVRRLNRAVPPDLETVVAVATERSADRRYQTALDLAGDLRRVLAREPIRARPSGRLLRFARWTQRHRGLSGGLAGAFLFLVAGLAVSLRLLAHAREQAEQTRIEQRISLRRAYRATLVAASAALASHDQPAARRSLDDAPAELRGFEWRHLSWISDRSAQTIRLGRSARGAVLAVVAPGAARVFLRGGATITADLRSGATRDDPEPDSPPIQVLTASPDGESFLVTAPIACRESGSHRERWRREDLARVVHAAFSSDGASVGVLADGGATVRILEAAGGRDAGAWSGPNPPGASIALCASGSRCLVASAHGVWMYDVPSGRQLWHRAEPFGRVSESGAAVLAASRSKNGSALLEGASGIPRWEADSDGGAIRMRALSDDATLVAEVQDSGILVVRDGATGAVRTRHAGDAHRVAWLSFLPGGNEVLTLSEGGEIRIWDARAGPPLFVAKTSNDSMNDSSFAPDGERIAAVGWGSLKIWEVERGAELRTVMLCRTMLGACAWSPDGTTVATGGSDGLLRLVDAGTGAVRIREAPFEGGILALAWSPDGGRIFAGTGAGSVVALGSVDLTRGEILGRHGSPVRCLAVSPDGADLAAGSGGKAAGGQTDASVRIFDLRSGRSERRCDGHEDSVLGLAFDPGGRRLVSGDAAGRAIVWDAPAGRRIAVLEIASDPVHGASISPDGDRIAFGCADGAIHLWDARHLEELLVLRVPVRVPRRFIWSPRDLFTSGGDSVICALETGPPLSGFARRDEMIRVRELVDDAFAVHESAREAGLALGRDDPEPGTPRRLALELARARGDQYNFINSFAWGAVLFPGKAPAEYERALRGAELAAAAWPQDYGLRNTLGVAQFRAGHFQNAIATLRHCEDLRRTAGRPLDAVDLIVQAMAHHRLGRAAAAADLLERARPLIDQSTGTPREESLLFLREAESSIGAR